MSAAINSEVALESVPSRSPEGEQVKALVSDDTPLLVSYAERQQHAQAMQRNEDMPVAQAKWHHSVFIGLRRIKDTLNRFWHTRNLHFTANLDDHSVATSSSSAMNPSNTESIKTMPETEINSKLAHKLVRATDTQGSATAGLTKKNKIGPSLHAVVLLLLALTHFTLWAAVIVLNLPPLVSNNWLVMLRLVRTPLLLVTWFYLLGVNMAVWTASNVNYILLFGFPRSVLTPAYIFGASGVITAISAVILSGFTFIVPAVEQNGQIGNIVIGIFLWALVMLFIFNPLRILCHRERFTFLCSLGRTVMSPFFAVRFFDTWFADQLVSLVVIMLDLEYFACYWIRSVANYDTEICTSNVYYIRTVITVLPTTWRYLQCLRSYVDTKDTKHIWNAIKYFTTYPVVFFATIYIPKSGNAKNWLFSFEEFDFDLDDGIIYVLWALSAFVNAMYSFVWDVIFDWDLFSFRNKRLTYRNQRIYQPKCWYGLAMVLDFVLRFLWTAKISLAVLYHQNVDLVFTVLALAEVFRRFFWNFIRLENQWIRTRKA